jgi:hypothetical protein
MITPAILPSGRPGTCSGFCRVWGDGCALGGALSTLDAEPRESALLCSAHVLSVGLYPFGGLQDATLLMEMPAIDTSDGAGLRHLRASSVPGG